MSQITPDKIAENYCIADDFCKEFAQEIKNLKLLPQDGKNHRSLHPVRDASCEECRRDAVLRSAEQSIPDGMLCCQTELPMQNSLRDSACD